jgi:two-component system, cell cycle sensor histidine kinase and response regulator CckA
MEAEFTLEQLRWAVKGAGVGVWQWEVASDRVSWSLEMGLLFGVPESAFPKNVAEYAVLLHPDDRESVQKAIESAIATRLQSFSIEHRILNPDGSVRWVGGKGRVESDEQGNPIRLGGTAVDISHQKAVEKQADQFRIFTELASDYIYVVEVREGTPLAPSIVAGSFERATGYTAEQVAKKGGWTSIIHPDDLPTMGPVFSGVAAGRPTVAEYRIIGPDGEIRWLRDHVRPELKDGVLIRMTGGVQDLTERKNLEQKLNHAQRMEALARLAGSVAHDFNNILLVISASIELMRPAYASSADAVALAGDVRTACKRASELTRTLLTFGRKVPTNAQVVSLDAAVTQCHTILARAAGERVKLTLDVSATTAPVELDVAQLQLVLLNLTLNAQAAMTAGGDLRIRVRSGEKSDGRIEEIAGDAFVVIEVSDTGSGISPEILPRIFEPFFTTKGPAEGSGLGLATCHGIDPGRWRHSCHKPRGRRHDVHDLLSDDHPYFDDGRTGALQGIGRWDRNDPAPRRRASCSPPHQAHSGRPRIQCGCGWLGCRSPDALRQWKIRHVAVGHPAARRQRSKFCRRDSTDKRHTAYRVDFWFCRGRCDGNHRAQRFSIFAQALRFGGARTCGTRNARWESHRGFG